MGVTDNCIATTGGGTAGCVMSLDITGGFPTVNADSTALAAAGGATGIIVDNDSSLYRSFEHLLRDQNRGDPGQSHAVRAELMKTPGVLYARQNLKERSMSAKKSWFYRLPLDALVFCMVAVFPVLIHGQTASPPQRMPMTEDWSTHHLVFSDPGSFEQARQTRPFLEWDRALSDPRYQFVQIRRNAAKMRRMGRDEGQGDTSDDRDDHDWAEHGPRPPRKPVPEKTKPEGDWNIYLGGAASAGIDPTMYPAKYTWDVNAAPNCSNDFVVVTVNQPPANQTNATGTIVINADPAEGDSLMIGSTVYGWHAATTTVPLLP